MFGVEHPAKDWISAKLARKNGKKLKRQGASSKTKERKGDKTMKNRGFTLIELMIVVAIIAIIAAIAIPNLLRSRMAANETAAIGACKTYVGAQNTFRRTDFDADAVLEYATTLRGFAANDGLYETFNGVNPSVVSYVDLAFANAEGSAGGAPNAAGPAGPVPAPKQGYSFAVLTTTELPIAAPATWTDANGNLTTGFGLSAAPFEYDTSGRNCFEIDTAGTCYQRDKGPGAATVHNTDFEDPAGGGAAGVPWTVCE